MLGLAMGLAMGSALLVVALPPSPPSPPGSSQHWAVIMAGSNTYGNYRHQADACHAYQIARKNGIPESNIILLAYDDIAHDRRNPFPGKMFNKPTAKGTPGKDVYAGCKIDYKGKEVNAANFLKVLSGDTSARGPVLKSTANDHVFVYYADHGGVGILGVPGGVSGGYIHATDINKAIETLQRKGGYKELLFYLEACESGSIFKGLLKAPNAKAVTAANASESSWGWYCPTRAGSDTGGDMVDGKHLASCLGDEFSVRWMEDTDAASITSETVGQQFANVKAAVTKSHVQEFGATSFDSEPIGNFEGGDGRLSVVEAAPVDYGEVGVDSRQVEVHQAYYQVLRAETAAARKDAEGELSAILARRRSADAKFGAIASIAMQGDDKKAQQMLEGDVSTTVNVEWQCHKSALELTVKHCGPFTDYSLRYSRLFANLCAATVDEQTLRSAIETGCGQTETVVPQPNYVMMWNDFKNTFGKLYNGVDEENNRFKIFKANVDIIQAVNAENLSYTLGVNQFADLTRDEFASQYTGLQKPENIWGDLPYLGRDTYSGKTLATSVDWTTKGAVTPVKNQGSCGSCWAFSTTGSLEGAWAIADGKLVSFSEQQFVDCDKVDLGCGGGLMDTAFKYAKKNALCTEESYAYKGRGGTCQASSCTVGLPKGGVTGYQDVSKDDEQALMEAVTKNPVSIAIEADKSAFQSYHTGILSGACGTKLDHGVLAVGYGTDGGKDYWKVKNSWGTTWGDQGYIRLLRGKRGAGECGLLSGPPSYPVVAKLGWSEITV